MTEATGSMEEVCMIKKVCTKGACMSKYILDPQDIEASGWVIRMMWLVVVF